MILKDLEKAYDSVPISRLEVYEKPGDQYKLDYDHSGIL